MFFLLSKTLRFAASPTNAFVGCVCLGSALLFGGWWREGRILASFGAITLLVAGAGPVGFVLAMLLENRFSRPEILGRLTGVIVLGGGIDEAVTQSRGSSSLTHAGSRMPEGVALALRHRDAKLVFTGGSADLGGSTTTEAAAAQAFFIELGIAPERLILEDQSRNTFENALFTRAIVKPAPDERWLLVTSAYHMPRAVGVFRKAGFSITPWPSGYETSGRWSDVWRPRSDLSSGLRLTDRAAREWIGLFAYWATGKTDALFPKP